MRAEADEYALFGIRGDGKTIGVLAAILAHAQVHKQKGFALPVPWMALRDSFANHKVTTLESLLKSLWGGRWRLYDNNHLAAFRQGAGQDDLVLLKLAGCDNMDAVNKLRQEVVGVWVQEAAPVEQSGGVSETAYGIANSSKGRIPTFHSPSISDMNYPDADFWAWERFITDPQPGTKAFQIPPRENKHVDLSYWDQMERSLSNRPDLRRRLLEGKPGMIMLGQPVAQSFNLDYHVAKESLELVRGTEIGIGFDGGHTPTAIIGQQTLTGMKIFASLYLDNGGMRQLLETQVLPWLARRAPWTLRDSSQLLVGYDPSLDVGEQSDIDQSALRAINDALSWPPCEAGPVRWPNRKDALLQALSRREGLVIDPSCDPLIKALSGRWYYPKSHIEELRSDIPKKPNHPWEDLGDALIYLLCRFGVVGTEMWSNAGSDQIEIKRNLEHFHQ
jgi:hypothetical protein